MKMIRSTSTTSTSGVMLMSLLYSPVPPAVMAIPIDSPGARLLGGSLLFLVGDQADVLEPRLLGHLHDVLDLAVLEPLVGLDDQLGLRGALVELVQPLLE